MEGLVLPCLSPRWCPAVLPPPLSVAAWPDPDSEPRGECGTPKSIPLRLSQMGARALLVPVCHGARRV